MAEDTFMGSPKSPTQQNLPWDPYSSPNAFQDWYAKNFANLQDMARWAAHQPDHVQKGIAAALGSKGSGDYYKALERERLEQASHHGNVLPGVSPSLSGVGDKETRSQALLDQNLLDSNQIRDQVNALGLDAYTYDPTMDAGPGYELPDAYKTLGKLSPLDLAEQEAAINQGRTDTTGLDAQKGTLQELDRLYNEGGLSAIDRARMARARSIRGIQARGQEEAIMADAAEQGRGGGNLSLVGRLMSQQAAAGRLSQDDMDTQAMALARRDNLLRDKASIGMQVQTAQDAIDRFNTEGERDRIKRNIETQNAERTRGADRAEADVVQYNRGADTQFDADTKRSTENTDRTNEAAKFNVGPNQGARGQVADRIGATGIVSAARADSANMLMNRHHAGKAADAAARQAWINAGTGLVGGVVDGVVPG